MKAIIFDIDGVIVKSDGRKKEIIKNILQKHNLYDITGVREILGLGLNRKVILDRIYDIVPFDKEAVLDDINYENAIIESNPTPNDVIIDFIKNNNENYILCANTSLPADGLNRIIDSLDLGTYFSELLAFENGTKVENINFVINKYNINPKEVLFIDDNINHIDKIRTTGVNILHFIDYNIDIEKEIANIESNL